MPSLKKMPQNKLQKKHFPKSAQTSHVGMHFQQKHFPKNQRNTTPIKPTPLHKFHTQAQTNQLRVTSTTHNTPNEYQCNPPHTNMNTPHLTSSYMHFPNTWTHIDLPFKEHPHTHHNSTMHLQTLPNPYTDTTHNHSLVQHLHNQHFHQPCATMRQHTHSLATHSILTEHYHYSHLTETSLEGCGWKDVGMVGTR